jgi:hypothetical protein
MSPAQEHRAQVLELPVCSGREAHFCRNIFYISRASRTADARSVEWEWLFPVAIGFVLQNPAKRRQPPPDAAH